MESTVIQARKMMRAIQIRLPQALALWLFIVTGCQPIASTLVSGSSTDTWTPSPVTQTASITPAIVPTLDDDPIALIGRIIDGTGAEPIEDGILIIQQGLITSVGSSQAVEIPPEANVLELNNSTILPGFINAHVHNGYDPVFLQTWAKAGVTTVRDLGAEYTLNHFSMRDRNNMDPDLATAITAGPLITVPGGFPVYGGQFQSWTVANTGYAREKVTRLIDEGADVIKIVVDSGDGLPTFSLELISTIIDTAHQRGLPVAAHIGSNLHDLELALDGGVDDISHIVGERIPAEVLEQMAANDMYWVPTLETAGGFDGGNLSEFIERGGQIALGNDSGMLSGIELGMPMKEIEFMKDAGMTPMEIIVAATQNAAHVCNREGTLGTLEAGKIADVLVVNGDPLEDLQALKDVRLVIHHGVIIRDSTKE